jgi:hypothetical protein
VCTEFLRTCKAQPAKSRRGEPNIVRPLPRRMRHAPWARRVPSGCLRDAKPWMDLLGFVLLERGERGSIPSPPLPLTLPVAPSLLACLVRYYRY